MLTIDKIISELNVADDSYFPREALEDAITQQEAITPVLLDIIYNISNGTDSLEGSPAFMYSTYLLAQFREKRAYPIVVKYFGDLGLEDEALDPTGDMVTEDLDSILASVCHGDLGLIKQLIEAPEVNEYVKNAAFSSLVILYNNNLLTREDLVSYIENILERETDPSFIAYIAGTACDFHPKELYDALAKCFDQELLEEGIIDREDFDDYMQMDIDVVLAKLKDNRLYQLVNNVVSEMGSWGCFHPEPISTPIRYDSNHKIGRNDACPCGSGKKYKKCCLH